MKILLTDAAADPRPDTLLIFAGRPEGELMTVSSDRRDHGFVAQATWPAVFAAIERAREPIDPDDPERDRAYEEKCAAEAALRREIEWLARALLKVACGSQVGQTFTGESVPALDFSPSVEVDRARDLAEGDRVAVSPPAAEEFVNSRGTVVLIHGDRAWVEMDPDDRDRLVRSRVGFPSSETVEFPRCFLEPIHGRRSRRALNRAMWRVREIRVPNLRSSFKR
jgi:hypothetical protein